VVLHQAPLLKRWRRIREEKVEGERDGGMEMEKARALWR
jgi:hypothetical protein